MNLIEHLTRTITPILLGNHTDTTGNYTSLLEKVYAIFIARLADNQSYSVFGDAAIEKEDVTFLDRLLPNSLHRSNMVQELSKHYSVSEDETQTLVSRAAPLVLNELRGLSGTMPLPAFLANNISSVASVLPTWAYAFIPAGILTALNISPAQATTNTTAHTANTRVEENLVATPKPEETSGLPKWLLPLIALLILGGLAAMLLKGCGKDNETPRIQTNEAVVAPASVASATPASLLAPTLAFATGADGALTLGGLGIVGDEGLKSKILGAFTNVFGTDAEKAVSLNVDPTYDVNFPAADKLTDVLNLVKGVPSASVKFDGNHVMVATPDDAATTKLIDGIKALLPDYNVMADSAMPMATASAPATEEVVISSTEPSVYFENGRLNFYFATGKADVAPQAVEKAKEILEAAKQGKKLGVSGYTDSTGNATANEKLSKERAQAVQKFLIDNGVPEAQLELIKPKNTVGAQGKEQEGRRVEVYIVDGPEMIINTETVVVPASTTN